MAAQPIPHYDPSVIELAAERLLGKASSVLVGSIVTGAVVGIAFGAVPLTSLGAAWPIPSMFGFATMLVGGVVGGLVGYVIGDARAFGYRLQAQATLAQLALERNTAVAAEALAALAGGRAAPRPASAPAPAPTPASAPAPQAQPQPRPAPAPAPRPAATQPAPPASVAPPPGPPPSVAPPTRV